MADWEIRPASASDVEAVAELRAIVMRADLERLGRYDEQRVRQRLRDGFDAAHTRVIEVDGSFAGCVTLRPAQDCRWLEHFYLAPRSQGSGIGTAVLRELLEGCDRAGAVVRLNVLRGSGARRLYERHGFQFESQDAIDIFMVRDPALRTVRHGGSCGRSRPEARLRSLQDLLSTKRLRSQLEAADRGP